MEPGHRPFPTRAPRRQGPSFKIEETFFKYWPVMYSVLLPMETALELRKQVDMNDIDCVRVVVDAFSRFTSNRLKRWDPHNRETADHSIPYLMVAALVDGEVTERTYAPERFQKPQIPGLLKKLTMKDTPRFTRGFPKTFRCFIDITGKSGRKWSQHLKNPEGHPGNPTGDAEIEEKFLKLVQHTLTPQQAKNAQELLWDLEELEDIGRIFDALVSRELYDRPD